MTLGRLPPLAALRAFAAFVEAGTLVRAAEVLNVSHPAVSQQLKALESHLGLSLFDRSGAALRLTAEGRLLAEAVTAGFSGIQRAVDDLTGADASRPLMVTTTPTFASAWLLPRLADFRARHPEIALMLDPSSEVRTLGPGGIDAAIRYGAGDWPGLQADLLIDTPVAVVAAPALLAAGRPGPDALCGMPWIQELGTTEATDVQRRLGLDGSGPGLVSMPGNLMLDAVRDGQGIAAIARAFVEADIAAGRLVLLHEDAEREGYWLVTRPGVLRPSARAFVQWIRRQAGLREKSAPLGPALT